VEVGKKNSRSSRGGSKSEKKKGSATGDEKDRKGDRLFQTKEVEAELAYGTGEKFGWKDVLAIKIA